MEIQSSGTIQKITDIENFINLETGIVLRYFLIHALAWKKKKSYTKSDLIYWIRHSIFPSFIYTDFDRKKIHRDVITFLSICNSSTIRSLVTKLRKNKKLSIFELELYKLLSGE